MTIGSKARARRASHVVKELYSWQNFIEDLHRDHKWTNGGRDVHSIYAEDLPMLGLLPRGYSYVGEGASRIAIRASDGFVYKVSKSGVQPVDPEDKWSYNTGESQNHHEAEAYQELKGLRVKGIRLAKTYKVSRTVNVAEYVDGPDGGMWDEDTRKRYRPILQEFVDKCRQKGWIASDIYYDNIKMNKYGTFVIVDIGCFFRVNSDRN